MRHSHQRWAPYCPVQRGLRSQISWSNCCHSCCAFAEQGASSSRRAAHVASNRNNPRGEQRLSTRSFSSSGRLKRSETESAAAALGKPIISMHYYMKLNIEPHPQRMGHLPSIMRGVEGIGDHPACVGAPRACCRAARARHADRSRRCVQDIDNVIPGSRLQAILDPWRTSPPSRLHPEYSLVNR